ncbi:MAG: hypothetical protein NZ927_03295 [Candidatus Calescibacterium sp.]|nr:hypothetical protein [Candidatus Calescibacterium sp.]MCX7733911.1 hypothetical protein [bacterium]MDW8086491.1 hypothetical protein [Candidatus Calescibacterium sp.]
MKIILKEQGKKIPKIIGLDTIDIFKITLSRVKENIRRNIEDIEFIVFQDSFVPPDQNLVQMITEYIDSKNKSINFDNVFYINRQGDQKYTFSSVPSTVFRISDGDKFSKAIKILQDIKNKEISKKAFLYSPEETYVSLDSEIGQDTVLYPYTYIISSKIGKDVKIHQGNTISNCEIEDGVEIFPYCYIEGAYIETDVKVGPFARMRPQVKVKKGARIGNFAEIKNSEIGEDTKVQHFSYIGDSVLGRNVNIGAGTVTCNFDGKNKNKTIIGDNVFVGSGSMLIAPIKLDSYSYIGAGSSINKNVPSYSLAVERADIKIIPEWVKRKKLFDEVKK